MEQFLTFHKFADVQQAQALTELLKQNNIPYELEDTVLNFNPNFTGSRIGESFIVKLKKEDFHKTEMLLKETSQRQFESIDKNHFLFNFSDEELMEVLEKQDEWGYSNYYLAQRILEERGKKIDLGELERIKQNRIAELAQPKEPHKALIIFGYVFALMGGLFGLLIGWHLATYRETLLNGESVYGFTSNGRSKGKEIFFIGLIVLVFGILVRIFLPLLFM